MSRRLTNLLDFVNFGNICSTCNINCYKRFYAVLLPEEENIFSNTFSIRTQLRDVKALGSKDGKPCPYLGDRGFCKIYDVRPFDCRVWPILLYYDFEKMRRLYT